ncbi:MAG: DUF302 domain-containing protein [Coriobacteriia bacterium]
MSYFMSRTLSGSYDDVVVRTREALATEGFGVLTEIDVKATLKKKLDADFRDYVILGACNPPLAHQVLQAERNIGLMLPCNVVVQEGEEEGTVEVSALDPTVAMQVVEGAGLEDVASQVRDKLARVLERV